MKKLIVLALILTLVYSCKSEKKEVIEPVQTESEVYASFGDKITVNSAISALEMGEQYKNLETGDTLLTKVSAKIKEVCSSKGCWMKLDLGDDKEVMVKFKDYGFFMPLDAKGDVIINGKAFVSEVSVDELQHYAEDAGQTKEEIAAIIVPEKTFSFEANGVLLKQ